MLREHQLPGMGALLELELLPQDDDEKEPTGGEPSAGPWEEVSSRILGQLVTIK